MNIEFTLALPLTNVESTMAQPLINVIASESRKVYFYAEPK
jgi:hypothetical protein